MTLPIILVLAVIVLAILLFVFEFVRIDVVGILMMVLLPLLGLITPQEAISGLSSNAVVIIVAIIIFGAGLEKTGAMNSLAGILLKFVGRSETRIMLLISATVAFISSFMQNIGAAALFMPAAKRICRQANVPASRILMPMGFSAIIGGCITLIGSSPLILLNDVMKITSPDAKPFGLFDVTPIGLALIASFLLYLVLFGRFILPAGHKANGSNGPMSKTLQRTYHDIGNLFELSIPPSFVPKTLMDLEIRAYYFTTVIGVAHKGGTKNFAPDIDTELRGGDIIAVEGPPGLVKKLAAAYKWEIKDRLSVFAEDLSPANAGIVEAVISPRSEMARNTLHSFSFRKKYGVNPLAVRRGNKTFVGGISDIILQTGDTLLLQGRWDKFHFLKEQLDLVFTEEIHGAILKTDKLKYAIGSMLLSLTLILAFHINLSIALLTGALCMILTDVLTIDEAYESVDWMTVFLLGGIIPLGIAFEKTGAARFIVETLFSFSGPVSPLLLLAALAILTSFLTLVVSNIVTAVLMIPLAMNMALYCGADPRMAALVVAISCSNNFILPTHQVNSMVLQPGGYQTMDYFKAGSGMTILFLLVMLGTISLFYGI
ncbi:MAG: SLC13 family permease [Proteobacteria bacterium]|nr:SLC13 family permease [Pseudomonadota bacterium]MBU0965697.1 SLC13 family permease [Pseudomonadota bacterium]